MLPTPSTPTQVHTPRQHHWAVGIALCLWLGLLAASPNFRPSSDVRVSPLAGDFLQEWIGGQMLRHGDHTRFYDPEYAQEWEHRTDVVGWQWNEADYFPMVYPPFYYALVMPLSYFPFMAACLVWVAIMGALYLLSWWLWLQLPGENRSHSLASWCLPGSLFFMPLIENFTSCQKGSVLLLILTGTYSLLVRGRPLVAGLVFGCLAFKPQYALPIALVMLCKRQWWFVLGGAMTGGGLVAVCGCLGLDLCQQYVEFSRHATEYLHSGGYDLSKSHSWHGFFSLLWSYAPSAGGVISVCTTAAWLITVVIVARSLRGECQPGSTTFAYQFSSLVICTVLLSPHVYTYDLTMLLLPLGLLFQHRQKLLDHPSSQYLPQLAILAFCGLGISPAIARATHVQISVLLMLAMLVGLSSAIAPFSVWNGLSLTGWCLMRNRSPAKST
jgi:Glycosyltransferase family 87